MSAIVKSETFDGWTLAFGSEGEPLVHDLELAERAGLRDTHEIRKTMAKVVADGEVQVLGGKQVPGGDRILDLPRILEVRSKQPMPNGRGHRDVTDYYYSEEAAALVAMRLRTKAASVLRRELVRVFVAWRRGQLEAAPRPLAFDTTVANSARIGDDPVACQRYRLARQRAANATGCSMQRLDGYVRRTQRVSTWKAVSLHLLDRLVTGFEHLELGLVHLTTKRERKLLEVVRKSGQLELFDVAQRKEGMH